MAGLSQEELAHRVDMHQTYLSGVEDGKRNPSIGVLARIVTALGVDIEGLFRVAHVLSDDNERASKRAFQHTSTACPLTP